MYTLKDCFWNLLKKIFGFLNLYPLIIRFLKYYFLKSELFTICSRLFFLSPSLKLKGSHKFNSITASLYTFADSIFYHEVILLQQPKTIALFDAYYAKNFNIKNLNIKNHFFNIIDFKHSTSFEFV